MIHALAWSCPQHCGYRGLDGPAQKHPAPNLDTADAVTTLINRPIKYFSRMTTEARHSLCAAGLALQATRGTENGSSEIALLGAGYAGCLVANQQYFRDYATNGRMMGRANLFIYTLPTSILGEIAIPLKLTGPMLHLHSDAQPVATLIYHAEQLLADHEADQALVLWSSLDAAICLALSGCHALPGRDLVKHVATDCANLSPMNTPPSIYAHSPITPLPELPPLELAHYLATAATTKSH